MEYGLRQDTYEVLDYFDRVLILVLMEYGLRHSLFLIAVTDLYGLNPCFNGIWSATFCRSAILTTHYVLILVLMEYGLRQIRIKICMKY